MEIIATVALTGEVIIDKIAVGASHILQSERAGLIAACSAWLLVGLVAGSALA